LEDFLVVSQYRTAYVALTDLLISVLVNTVTLSSCQLTRLRIKLLRGFNTSDVASNSQATHIR